MLKFGIGIKNQKLRKLENKINRKIYSFSIPAGKTCPFAIQCKSQVIETPEGLRIKDGPKCQFRCYAASMEALYTKIYYRNKYNLAELRKCKTVGGMERLIEQSIPNDCEVIRLHVAGDFFNEKYFVAWRNIAKKHPNMVIYGYTKAINYLLKYPKLPNFRLTASHGGKLDYLILTHHELKSCTVVMNEEEAKRRSLPIDKDDTSCYNDDNKSFAIIIHGTQPAKNKKRKVELVAFSTHMTNCVSFAVSNNTYPRSLHPGKQGQKNKEKTAEKLKNVQS